MTVRLIHKQGDTFLIDCQAFVDLDATIPRNLTNVTVTATMDAPLRDPYTFTVEITSAENGQFQLQAPAADTEEWGSRVWYASITYTDSTTSITTSTETWQLEVVNQFNTIAG